MQHPANPYHRLSFDRLARRHIEANLEFICLHAQSPAEARRLWSEYLAMQHEVSSLLDWEALWVDERETIRRLCASLTERTGEDAPADAGPEAPWDWRARSLEERARANNCSQNIEDSEPSEDAAYRR